MQIISQIALTCSSQAKTEDWYTKYFSFRRARVAKLPDGKEIIFLKMADSAFYLELFAAESQSSLPIAENDGYTFPSFRHLAFKVENVDAKLKELGDDAFITLGPLNFDDYIPGWRTVWIRDPDGRIIEISQGFKDEF